MDEEACAEGLSSMNKKPKGEMVAVFAIRANVPKKRRGCQNQKKQLGNLRLDKHNVTDVGLAQRKGKGYKRIAPDITYKSVNKYNSRSIEESEVS